jgi:hypothetical protein
LIFGYPPQIPRFTVHGRRCFKRSVLDSKYLIESIRLLQSMPELAGTKKVRGTAKKLDELRLATDLN